MKILNKISLAAILALSLTSVVSADECEYWHEMLDIHVPATYQNTTSQTENKAAQGVDAYYQTYYYD